MASDGEGQNGLHTENLVRELGKRNTRIEDALKRVRLNVIMGWQDDQLITSKPKWESDPIVSPSPSVSTLALAGTPIEIGEGAAVPKLIAPSANPFSAGRYPLARIFTVGDSATIRQSDLLTGIEEHTRTLRVTKVDYDEDRVEFNQGAIITDLMGNFIKQGPNEYDTPVQFTPAEFQVGKKWTAAFHRFKNGETSNVSLDMKIVKRETISVPAGTFDTFRIEGAGWNLTRGNRREVKFRLVPGLNFPVRSESVTQNKRGRFVATERRELVALRQRIIAS